MSGAVPYDPHQPRSNVSKVMEEMDNAMGNMRDNLNKVTERGEALDDVDQRANVLANNASTFRKSANTVRKRMWMKNLKMKLCLALVIIILLIVIIVPIAIHFS
ncbi:unnamed protein product [Kuraishia capsulata CBS 1993]|uniref:V-SNARE coiled-coil homology domain-containing protein n=1 Tax=Kuraishia capsulata CBS 1993 TaxID=1382522 RepID=W6MMQ8_9ASCO|nr:uncharacterized protein KUCA_T00003835001 [Kuraishia capsulata CBS 1993]CDK27856.1 unnamed protein product [Kuraishia capsulata CBS 1993]